MTERQQLPQLSRTAVATRPGQQTAHTADEMGVHMDNYLRRLFRKKSVVEEPLIRESKAIFWFNWQEISDSGHLGYGRWVYQLLLPHFVPKPDEWAFSHYTFWDGDFLPQGKVDLPKIGPEGESCLARAKQCGFDSCYLVAVFGLGPVPLSGVDQKLSTANVVGYIGMTPCSTLELMPFMELANSMALVPACDIIGKRFKKESFAFISDDELRAIGFETESQ